MFSRHCRLVLHMIKIELKIKRNTYIFPWFNMFRKSPPSTILKHLCNPGRKGPCLKARVNNNNNNNSLFLL